MVWRFSHMYRYDSRRQRWAETCLAYNKYKRIYLFIYLFTITFQRGKWWFIVVSSVKIKYSDEF
jgi:hypothetical protein